MTKEQKEALKEKQRQSGYEHKGNLIPINERSPQEQLEIQRKGKEAQLQTIRKRKELKDICNDLLSISALDLAKGVINDELREKIEKSQYNVTLYDLIIAKQAENALNGSTKAAEFIRDSSGDKPKNDIDVDISVITESDRNLLNNLSDRIEALEAIDITTP